MNKLFDMAHLAVAVPTASLAQQPRIDRFIAGRVAAYFGAMGRGDVAVVSGAKHEGRGSLISIPLNPI